MIAIIGLLAMTLGATSIIKIELQTLNKLKKNHKDIISIKKQKQKIKMMMIVIISVYVLIFISAIYNKIN